MRWPFFASVGLHVLFGLAMLWASYVAQEKKQVLPQATVVKLFQPKSIDIPPSPKPSDEMKVPETKPPLTVPKPEKNPVKEPVKVPEPEKPRATQQPPKELTGNGVTLKLKNSGFEYDFYLGLIQSKIQQNFRPPPGKKSSLAVVSFIITKTGDITNVQLTQSSDNLLVDQAAQRAVRAAGHFPPLPAQYGSDQLAVNIEFVANPGIGG